MEEPAIQAPVLQFSHRAGITVRQDGLRPVGRCGDPLELCRDRVDGFRPSDRFQLATSFRARATQGCRQTFRMVNPVEIVGDLLAQESIGERIRGIPLQTNRAARRRIDGDNPTARVGAIVRASSFDGDGGQCVCHWQSHPYGQCISGVGRNCLFRILGYFRLFPSKWKLSSCTWLLSIAILTLTEF